MKLPKSWKIEAWEIIIYIWIRVSPIPVLLVPPLKPHIANFGCDLPLPLFESCFNNEPSPPAIRSLKILMIQPYSRAEH